jgi:hypothetical protein
MIGNPDEDEGGRGMWCGCSGCGVVMVGAIVGADGMDAIIRDEGRE